jgi:hypothetical protein
MFWTLPLPSPQRTGAAEYPEQGFSYADFKHHRPARLANPYHR